MSKRSFDKLSHAQIVERQISKASADRIPCMVVLNDIRSLENVGSIFRTADGAGIEKVWLCGITGYPPQKGLTKASLGAEDSVPWEYRKDGRSLLNELKSSGYQIVFLEQMQGAQSHSQFKPTQKTCIVIGNEISGIDESWLDLCDVAVEIEMAGIKNSLNVAVAFGIMAYAIRTKLLSSSGSSL